jgi:hypothetical protein
MPEDHRLHREEQRRDCAAGGAELAPPPEPRRERGDPEENEIAGAREDEVVLVAATGVKDARELLRYGAHGVKLHPAESRRESENRPRQRRIQRVIRVLAVPQELQAGRHVHRLVRGCREDRPGHRNAQRGDGDQRERGEIETPRHGMRYSRIDFPIRFTGRYGLSQA